MTKAEGHQLRVLVRAVLPPFIFNALRRLRNRFATREPEWEYVPDGWARARTDPRVRGWNVDAVTERYRLLWPEWLRALQGNGTLGVDYTRSLRSYDADARSVPSDLPWAHNAVMSYAYVLALTARDRRRLSILDWGGGVGQFLPLSEALLPAVEFEYHVKDVQALCSLGRELNPEASFYEDDSWQERRYDLAFSSSAFQFSEDWRGTLEALAKVTRDRLFISRVPIVLHSPSFVVLQRAETYGFETEFLGWFLNREEFVDCARGAGLELVREFVMMDETPAHRAPEQATYRGFLFRPAGTTSPE
jgi:putative methyltransferase (TIGR04325 family)